MRLDQWFTKNHPERSRSQWQKKIKTGEILVNGRKASAHQMITPNDQVTLHLKTETTSLKPEAIPLSIIYEDNTMVILDKPAGLVVHPGSGNKEHTLVHGLIHHYESLKNWKGTDRPGIVHRLDKDTSGILVVAKNQKTHMELSQQFETKKVEKTYLTLVHGIPKPDQGSIEAPLTRSQKDRKKITVTAHPKSRYALTHYKVLKKFKTPIEAALLEVKIETGRTHQIRVHFEAIGHPVVGDTTYGNRKINTLVGEYGLHRQFLHAHRLNLISNGTQKRVEYESALPKELDDFLKKCL